MTGTEPEDDDALAAEYALGLLEPEAARAFEDRMATEPALRASYAFWAERLAAFTEDLPEEAPPPTTFEDIEDRLFPLHSKRRVSGFGSLRGVLFGGLAAAVLALAVIIWPQQAVTPDFRFDIADSDSFVAIGVGATRGGVFHLILGDEFVEPPEGRDYEMWLIAGDNPPVSLGLVPRGVRGDVWAELPPELTESFEGGVFAVSLEPEGGAPDGVPSEVLATAEIVTVG
ncbi:hypothetical protein HKCCE3408_16770 [Rhodobacterales bacterium HKCCE3408]|nr:hypothetical protein [Rhodobacterales bacterium HKCCE3408]